MRLLYSRHLEHFLSIYEAGSLRAAAQVCGVTQPALTRSLQLLELALGTSLFERVSAGIVPTHAGHVLRRHALHIRNCARYAAMEIDGLATGQAGELRIGCGMLWSVGVMPELLARLHAEFPRLRIHMETGIADALVPALADGKLDVIVSRVPEGPLASTLRCVEFAPLRVYVMARDAHPLHQRHQVALAALLEYDFLGYGNDQEFTARSMRFFGDRGLPPPRVVLTATSLDALLATALISDCLLILTAVEAARLLGHGLRILRTETALWTMRNGICYQVQIENLAPLRSLLDAARTLTDRALADIAVTQATRSSENPQSS